MRAKLGTAAILALIATSLPVGVPASAAALPVGRSVASVADGLAPIASHGRRYRDHRDDGIGAGDVIAGVLVLGAVAAIAGAFDGRDGRDEPRRYPADARRDDRDAESRGLSRAVDMCVAELEGRGDRVTRIDSATRDAAGWRVEGVSEDDGSFVCRIGNDGRVRDIGAGGNVSYQAALPGEADRQYADSVYARLRDRQGATPAAPQDAPQYEPYGDEPLPAYPGGPLPGEEGYDEYQAGVGQVSFRAD
jgi:hypothetical protein